MILALSINFLTKRRLSSSSGTMLHEKDFVYQCYNNVWQRRPAWSMANCLFWQSVACISIAILLFIYVANSNMIYVMSLQFANDFGMHLVPRMHDHHWKRKSVADFRSLLFHTAVQISGSSWLVASFVQCKHQKSRGRITRVHESQKSNRTKTLVTTTTAIGAPVSWGSLYRDVNGRNCTLRVTHSAFKAYARRLWQGTHTSAKMG